MVSDSPDCCFPRVVGLLSTAVWINSYITEQLIRPLICMLIGWYMMLFVFELDGFPQQISVVTEKSV